MAFLKKICDNLNFLYFLHWWDDFRSHFLNIRHDNGVFRENMCKRWTFCTFKLIWRFSMKKYKSCTYYRISWYYKKSTGSIGRIHDDILKTCTSCTFYTDLPIFDDKSPKAVLFTHMMWHRETTISSSGCVCFSPPDKFHFLKNYCLMQVLDTFGIT